MAELKGNEKAALENLFEMNQGYVLDFSNNSFSMFISESINVSIYDHYDVSKANCLRSFIKDFDDRKVSKLISDLLDYYETKYFEKVEEEPKVKNYIKVLRDLVFRLSNGEKYLNLPKVEDETIKSVMEEVYNAIERDKPEAALDRLHTYTTKYIREVCNKNGVVTEITDRGKVVQKPLHSLFGELTKKYIDAGTFDSDTIPTILKSNISILQKFNTARNDESMAHDNELLNKIEAEYIIRTVNNILIFIDKLEKC